MTFQIDVLKQRLAGAAGLYRRGLRSLPGVSRLRRLLRRAAFGLSFVLRGATPGGRGELAEAVAVVRDAFGPERLALPRAAWGVPAVLVSSAAIIALETLLFHVLQIVTDYLTATSVIGLAMFGIALGGLASFLLSRWNLLLTAAAAAVGLFLSLMHAYAAVVAIHSLPFPWPLILPFFFASFIISNVYAAGGNANVLSFANSLGSGLGVLVPLFLVPAVKSETLFILLLAAPCVLFLLTALRVRTIPLKAAGAVVALVFAALVFQTASANLGLPETFAADRFEKKILASVTEPAGKKVVLVDGEEQARAVNRQWEFMRSVYRLEGDTYHLVGDDDDRERARTLLAYIGAVDRFPVPGMTVPGPLSGRIALDSIDRAVFEGELAAAFALRYRTSMTGNPDLEFLSRSYVKKDDRYELAGTAYERLRAKYLLGELGFFPYYDLNLDVRRHGRQRDQMKYIASNDRLLLSEDNLIGRLEYGGDLTGQIMALNGVVLDSIDSYDGAHWDPRVPRVAFLDQPLVFIVGLSADGIVKSARRLPGATVAGVELHPSIMRTMSEDGQFATLARRPYDRVEAHEAEGRSFLENDPRRWDMISLMNIHAEHGPLNTVAPENLHTVEGVRMMLDRLTDRGMIVFEEIVMNERSELAFRKFLATCRAALADVTSPERCFYLFRWDFWGENGNFRTLVLRRTPLSPRELRDLDDYYEACAGRYPGSRLLFRPDRKLGTAYESFILGEAPLSGPRLPAALGARDMAGEVVSRLDDPRDAEFLLAQYSWTGRSWVLKDADRSAAEEERLTALLTRIGTPLTTDLAPVTDDKPFPYAVYAEKTEIGAIVNRSLLLALILLVPILILLLRGAEARPLILGPAVCFTGLSGFGFMLVEIILIQRFQLFLGSPAWNMAAVLGGMLFWSGLGSLAGRFLSKPLTAAASALIPVLLFIYLGCLPGWFQGLAGLDFAGKLAMSIVILFPISFLMGIPFPAALEAVKRQSGPSLTALLWGVSGGASTVAAAVGLYVNVTSGFTASFTLGAALYAAGSAFFLLLLFLTRKKAAA